MLNLRKIVDPVVAILSCALLSMGCTKEESAAAGSSEEQHKVTVQLNISTRAVTATTGALDDEESAIYSLRVYAFTTTGTPVGYEELEWLGGSSVGEAYYMDLAMVSTESADLDFYVVANEAAMDVNGTSAVFSEYTTEEQLKNFYFTGLNDLDTYGLPMYWTGEETICFNNLSRNSPADGSGHEGHTLLAQTVEVSLQRPMGKLGVFAAKAPDEMDGALYITGLTMLAPGNLSYNYLMPPSSTMLQSIPSSTVGDGNIVLTPVATEEVEDVLYDGYDRTDPENYTPVLDEPYYPFENPWGNGGDWSASGNNQGSVLQIDYTFDGAERTGLVYMPPIERNAYYTVLCLMHNGAISITINVADWDDPAETYVLDFDYPTYSPLVPSGSTGEESSYAQPTVYYNSDPSSTEGSYFFRFTITGPTGQEWTPTLLDATTADFEVTVLQGGVEVDPLYVADPDESYEIQVRALNSANVGKTVQLAIAFTPSWDQTGSSLLLINSDSKWEGSSYTDRVVILQTDIPN